MVAEFTDALTDAYLEDPCGVLPNTLWKTLDGIGDRDVAYAVDGTLEWFSVRGTDSTAIAWRRSPAIPFTDGEIARLGHAIVPQQLLTDSCRTIVTAREYFRLIHRHDPVPEPAPVAGYRLRQVDAWRESDSVARFLQHCYPRTNVTAEVVRSWTTSRVFSSDLWLWIVNDAGEPAALGVAEFDSSINEGSLEWIQSDARHRNRGLAMWVSAELLTRLARRAGFTTVSGEVANPRNPETLYRGLGFKGSARWILFTNTETTKRGTRRRPAPRSSYSSVSRGSSPSERRTPHP